MARLTDLEKVRRQRQRRRTVRNLLLLAVFAGVVWLGMWVVQRAGDLDLKTAYSDIKAEITTGSGYPVPLPGGKNARLDAVDNVVVLLSDTNLYSYNASGRQMLNVQHGIINQGMVTAQDRMLLYDRGGDKLSLYSKSEQLQTLTTEYKIYTADLAQTGIYAVATSSREYIAHVKVYNKSNQEIFNWYSYQKPVVSVSLSDYKEEMMVGCVDAADGSYLSSISKFQFSINQELGRAEFPDELLYSVDYESAAQVRALTDRRAILLNQELKELASYDYGGQKINRTASSPDGMLVLVLGDYAEDKKLTVVSLDKEFNLLGKFTVDHDISDIACAESHVFLASKNQLEIYEPGGTQLVNNQVNGIQKIRPAGGQLYYVTVSELDSMNIRELLAPAEEASSGKQAASDADSSAGPVSLLPESGEEPDGDSGDGFESAPADSSSQPDAENGGNVSFPELEA